MCQAVPVDSVLSGPMLTEGAKDCFDKLVAAQGISFDQAATAFFE